MTTYGSVNNTMLYKNIWINILEFLPENQWYKLKRQNKSFYNLIKKLCNKKKI